MLFRSGGKGCIEIKLIRSWKLATSLTALMAVLSSSLSAQSDNASISGVVKDPSGALVAGAKVTLIDERTTQEKRTTTNESGYYIFTTTPPGLYSIQVEAKGFKVTRQEHNETWIMHTIALSSAGSARLMPIVCE